MKKILIFLAAAAMICSCGTAKRSAQAPEGSEGVTDGYTTVKKDDNNYSIKKVSSTKAKNTFTDIYSMIKSTCPEVTLHTDNTATLRGISSIGDSSMLIIVDNIQMGSVIPEINPELVKSIEVLKDASASIYGVQGGNGVILITTYR